jgi:hypothetical protein
MLKQIESNQASTTQVRSRRTEDLFELRQWVAHVIEDAEKNGDTRRKAKFLALKAEL